MNSLLADAAARRLLAVNNFGQTLWFDDEGAEKLMMVLDETEKFENSQWPLETLETARENAQFRVVRWMEGTHQSNGQGKPSVNG